MLGANLDFWTKVGIVAAIVAAVASVVMLVSGYARGRGHVSIGRPEPERLQNSRRMLLYVPVEIAPAAASFATKKCEMRLTYGGREIDFVKRSWLPGVHPGAFTDKADC